MKSLAHVTAAKRPERTPAPSIVLGTVPRKPLNAVRRPREYLTLKEVGLLMGGACKRGRYGHRDATLAEYKRGAPARAGRGA